MRFIGYFGVIGATLALAGCGGGAPTDSVISETLERMAKDEHATIRAQMGNDPMLQMGAQLVMSMLPPEDAEFIIEGTQCSAQDDIFVCQFDMTVKSGLQEDGPYPVTGRCV
jgi:hypothetical protein